jgi:hypothetical protein
MDAMLVTVPDAGLNELLSSPFLLAQTWPGSLQEVMTLVHVLRIAEPSFHEALEVGLIKLITTTSTLRKATATIGVTHKRAVLTGVARRREDGVCVLTPHTCPREVTWLEVRDVAVEGRSGLRMAG